MKENNGNIQSGLTQNVVSQFVELMERSGFESITPVVSPGDLEEERILEATLLNLKTLNAKYDKNEAIQQIKCLMEKYNIQLDQLLDHHGIS